jgi:hypothetical protein
LPDQSTVQSGNQEQVISPAAQVNRKNWVDFPLDQAVPLNKLTLRVGRPSEHQMNIPLYPGASLTTYQDKVTSPNKTFQYASLAWTLKTATLSYSFADTQAPTNQLYTVVTLAATNSTSTNFENEPINYIRLQTQGNSIQPDDNSNFPLSIPAQANGSGTLAFLVPQDATSFTLVFLAQADANISQASVTFQIG